MEGRGMERGGKRGRRGMKGGGEEKELDLL